MAELRRLAARRVAHARGHLLEVDRARLAVGPADHGQRPRREPRALRALPAEAERLQRDGECHKQAEDMFALQDYIDAQFGGPARASSGSSSRRRRRGGSSTRQARHGPRRRGLGGPRLRPDLGTPGCDAAQIDRELDRLRRSACARCSPSTSSTTRSVAPHFDDGATGVLVNAGNKYATGRWWTAEHCARCRRTRQLPDQHVRHHGAAVPFLGQAQGSRCSRASCPPTRRRRSATRGIHAARRAPHQPMMRAGNADRDRSHEREGPRQALTILEAADYSGVISSHSWGDGTSQRAPADPGRA